MTLLQAICPITHSLHHELARAAKARQCSKSIAPRPGDGEETTPPLPSAHCPRCEGTGIICTECGESKRTCSCDDNLDTTCPDCNGTKR